MGAARPLSSIKGLLLDMDGVVYRGNTPTPGAAQFFQFLRSKAIKFGLITNNSQRTSVQYAEKLKGMGITVEEAAILPAGQATAHLLGQTARPGARLYVIGHDGLTKPLEQAGFVLSDDHPEYVVVGLDMNFSYDKLRIACQSIRAGARFIAANTDATLPTENTLLPGSGALVAAIETCSGVKPVLVGKPETTMLRMALDRIGVQPHEAAIVGDRLETDVLAGERAGITTILVLTGVSSAEDVKRSVAKPDYVFENLIQLRTALEQASRS